MKQELLIAANKRFLRALLDLQEREARKVPVRPDLARTYPNVPYGTVQKRTRGVLDYARTLGHPFRTKELVPEFVRRWGLSRSTTLQWLQAILHHAHRQGWVMARRRYWHMGLPEAQVDRYADEAVKARKAGARAAYRLLAQNPYCPLTEPRLYAKWASGVRAQLSGRINFRPSRMGPRNPE